MTREDAIDILKGIQDGLEETRFLERCALDMAIEALKDRPHITDKQNQNISHHHHRRAVI